MNFFQKFVARLVPAMADTSSLAHTIDKPTREGQNHTMSDLQDYLQYYKALDGPGYAVLVTGPWGAGKTYQVLQCFPEEERLYVSLFGVQTVDQLHSEVFAAAAPNIAKVESFVAKGSETVAGMKGFWALASAAPSVFSAVFKKEIEPTSTLIFDDLERSELKLKDVLGAINSYVEHLGFRAIVIAHDEKLTKKFLSMKEKSFGQSIRIKPQTEQALSQFIGLIGDPAAREFVTFHKTLILGVFADSDIFSLRILRHLVEDLARLQKCLKKVHLEDIPAMKAVVCNFVAFQLEVRVGNLKEPDLRNRRGKRMGFRLRNHANQGEPPSKPALVIADEKYATVNLESSLFSDDVLCAMLVEGRYPVEEIQATIDNSSYFLKPDQAPPWKVLLHFDELDDSAINVAFDQMNSQFERREVTNSGELLHIFSLRMMMAEQNIIDREVGEIAEENKAYIDDLLDQGTLPPREIDWRWKEDFKNNFDGFGYWVKPSYQNEFDEICDYLITAREKALEQTFPAVLETLLQEMHEDSSKFFEDVSSTNNGPNPYATIPLFHHLEPTTFVENWLSSPRENWRDIYHAIENRYGASQLFGELSLEKDWALDVLRKLEQRAEEETGFQALRITRIRPKVLINLATAIEQELENGERVDARHQ